VQQSEKYSPQNNRFPARPVLRGYADYFYPRIHGAAAIPAKQQESAGRIKILPAFSMAKLRFCPAPPCIHAEGRS